MPLPSAGEASKPKKGNIWGLEVSVSPLHACLFLIPFPHSELGLPRWLRRSHPNPSESRLLVIDKEHMRAAHRGHCVTHWLPRSSSAECLLVLPQPIFPSVLTGNQRLQSWKKREILSLICIFKGNSACSLFFGVFFLLLLFSS